MGTKTKRRRIKKLALTPGENLLLWRRRLNWNQSTAAKYFNCSLFTYKMAEYDKAKNFKYGKANLDELHPWERCLIYRKRSRLSQPTIAKKIGIGRYWLRLQEKGTVPCARLLEFWEHGNYST